MNNTNLIKEMEAAGTIPARVLTVYSEIKSNPGDILDMAKGVAEKVRELQLAGYDLRSAHVKAFMHRDDRFAERGPDRILPVDAWKRRNG